MASNTQTVALLLVISLAMQAQDVMAQCRGIGELMNECGPMLDVHSPPPLQIPKDECCEAYNAADIACVCKFLGKKPPSYTNVKRKWFVYGAQDCDVAIMQDGYNCAGEIARPR